ncbi:post-GPI attachment to proteins factor 3 [Contarinia nasturtii]|uniref:post-GPI attachment to proteins factor 3 n=1 Tax=Contarinia nasturtii TaxID=265458 RepID=UPI0012D45944|nr:post-GPI attachment to proteins factor 3 [Contarinia nasturtii]
METNMRVVIGFFILCMVHNAQSSAGDRSQFFVNCMKGCLYSNCTERDYTKFKPNIKQDIFNEVLLWSCRDECQYHCMWRTTNAFISREWSVPQFYGKWPFKRFFGIQEPASVFFSFLNLVAHWRMLGKFRQDVRNDSPLYYTWNVFSAICINAWICSIIFHARDFPLTELLDYGFAYSMVLANFCCMILRMVHWSKIWVKSLISLGSILFFLNHFSYLSVGRFDYQYNMKANILTGILTGIGWVIWYLLQRKKRPYSWKILLFQFLVAISLLLEVNDFPPLFWVFDAHALWHLSTVLPTILLYSFLIDDSQTLRREREGFKAL